MDPIRNISIASVPVALPGKGASADSAPALPKPASDSGLPAAKTESTFDVEKARYEAVMRASQEIANRFVLGDNRFTIYKDTSGQYITRFTNLRDGKVTYIPEPNLLNMRRTPVEPMVTFNV